VGEAKKTKKSAVCGDRRIEEVSYVDVPAKDEPNPGDSHADTPFGYGVDISLLLEYLCVLCHILGRAEGSEVEDIEL
jgi:hypothetical protein